MKKKNIKAVASLVTAVVVLIGGYIYKNDGIQFDNIPQSTKVQSNSIKDNVQGTESQSSSTAGTKAQSNEKQSGSPDMVERLEKTTFPESITKIQKEGIQPYGYINAYVEKVVDGDTFHIKYGDEGYKVRMLDIDTPESIKAGVDSQPYALEASELTKKTLTEQKIKLVFEKGTTDQYGRLLAHVILEDGTYYNALMVQNGYAISVFYSPNTLFKDYFAKLQNKAIENKAGFWLLPENDRPFVKNNKGKYIAAYKLKEEDAA